MLDTLQNLLVMAFDPRTNENEAINALKLCRKKIQNESLTAYDFFKSCKQQKKRTIPNQNMSFPFGKYKGYTFQEVAEQNMGYINWCIRTWKNSRLKESLRIFYESI